MFDLRGAAFAAGMLIAIIAVLAAPACASRETAPRDAFSQTVAAAVADHCGEELVLIGESGDHGRGATLALKSAIVRSLIDQCGFDAVLFESGFYDFGKIFLDRDAGAVIAREDIAASIGGIWNRYSEVAELTPFLTERVNAGALAVGGIDFNLGSAGAFYSLDAMPAELTGLLEAEAAGICAREMRRLIYSSYGRDGPQRADIDAISECADAMLEALDEAGAADLEAAVMRQMVLNMRAYADALIMPRDQRLQAREQAFISNFDWWRSQLPPDSKVIVWGASVHLAKTSSGLGLFREIDTLGAYVHRIFGDRARFLNFAAVSGSYRFRDREEQTIPEPAPVSVEALYLDLEGYRYLDASAVQALGVRPSSIYGGAPVTDEVSSITDSLIVIARERPPGLLP
jgi:erythromycin esterase-like protein